MNREGNNLGDKHPKSKNMLPCFFTICWQKSTLKKLLLY